MFSEVVCCYEWMVDLVIFVVVLDWCVRLFVDIVGGEVFFIFIDWWGDLLCDDWLLLLIWMGVDVLDCIVGVVYL